MVNNVVNYSKILYKHRLLILRIAISFLFLLSFSSKIISHEDYATYLMRTINISYEHSVVLANIILGIELYICIQLIVANNVLGVIAQALSIMIVFTIFLLYLALEGRDDNCFCFGKYLNLSPQQSIVKNILIILPLSYVIVKKAREHYKFINLKDIALLGASCVLLIVLFPDP